MEEAKMLDHRWLIVFGLLLSLMGVVIFALGLIIPRRRALEVGVSRIPGETEEENCNLPAVCDRLRQARRAMLGMVFLVLGFALQILGNVLFF
jgi:hypothetical protein